MSPGHGRHFMSMSSCPGLIAYHFTSYSSARLADWKLTLKLVDVGFWKVAPHGLALPVLAFHSFHGPFYDRSIASSKVGSQTV